MKHTNELFKSKLNDVDKKFYSHFQYYPEYPIGIYLEDETAFDEYKQTVEKCISDNFDYTIELYGTNPLLKGNPMQIMVD